MGGRKEGREGRKSEREGGKKRRIEGGKECGREGERKGGKREGGSDCVITDYETLLALSQMMTNIINNNQKNCCIGRSRMVR